jgi:hypothetical protein
MASASHYASAWTITARQLHETERGEDTWDKALTGMDWLNAQGFQIAIAGRTCWDETDAQSRAGYGELIARRGWRIDPADHGQLVLFPEMNEREDVPEITTACWDILGKRPDQQMCATSRMVIKRKGAAQPAPSCRARCCPMTRRLKWALHSLRR